MLSASTLTTCRGAAVSSAAVPVLLRLAAQRLPCHRPAAASHSRSHPNAAPAAAVSCRPSSGLLTRSGGVVGGFGLRHSLITVTSSSSVVVAAGSSRSSSSSSSNRSQVEVDGPVFNMPHTGGDKAPGGRSWIRFYCQQVGADRDTIKCSDKDCEIHGRQLDGGHVTCVLGGSTITGIIPLCRKHNLSHRSGQPTVGSGQSTVGAVAASAVNGLIIMVRPGTVFLRHTVHRSYAFDAAVMATILETAWRELSSARATAGEWKQALLRVMKEDLEARPWWSQPIDTLRPIMLAAADGQAAARLAGGRSRLAVAAAAYAGSADVDQLLLQQVKMLRSTMRG